MAKLKTEYGDQYNAQNVLLSATHTHSGPSGYSQYVLYNQPYRFSNKTSRILADGIFLVRLSSFRYFHLSYNLKKIKDVHIQKMSMVFLKVFSFMFHLT